MERGSTQHSGRMDDVLAGELEPLVRSGAEPRAHDDRLHEPPGDDEPSPDVRIAGEDVALPGLLDLDDVEARSRLATAVRPGVFPATRAQLLAAAAELHAPPDVTEALEALPARRRFVNVQQVWEALGGERERRNTAFAPGAGAATAPTAATAPSAAGARVAPATPSPNPPGPGGPPLLERVVRAGFDIALLPLRIATGAARAARDRLPH